MKLRGRRVQCPYCGGSKTIQEVEGADLRAARKRAGISIIRLAKPAGFSVSYFSMIERGDRRVTREVVRIYEAMK